MEDVLDLYSQLYDPECPVVCMDEQPIQLLKETRLPIAATPHHPQRVDYQYERAGTASIFMFCDPLSGWRHVRVREHRTKIDWATEVETLLASRYAQATKIRLVCDNFNTHTKGAFYETFLLSALTRQCLRGRRIPDITTLQREVTAWEKASNEKQRGIDWQFQVDDARAKLKSLYPNF